MPGGTEMAEKNKEMTFGRLIVSIILTSLVFPVVILVLGGSIVWIEGWIFSLWFVAMILSTVIYMFVKDPDLLAERRKAPGSGNQKRWDVYILYAIFVISIVWILIMPLDAKRFGWSSTFPLWLKMIGGLLLILSIFFIFATTVQNTYLSTRVRIQSDRKQQVISTGVYGFVRHPLYLGYLLLMIGGPLLLGSIVGLALGLLGSITIVARIFGEEKMLLQELEGYEEYRKKVGYRLIPFIW
jgi:protein-S-isoprenylcysteine O-methyltransferase Ste14